MKNLLFYLLLVIGCAASNLSASGKGHGNVETQTTSTTRSASSVQQDTPIQVSILSLDGGGIKGLVPSLILEGIEREVSIAMRNAWGDGYREALAEMLQLRHARAELSFDRQGLEDFVRGRRPPESGNTQEVTKNARENLEKLLSELKKNTDGTQMTQDQTHTFMRNVMDYRPVLFSAGSFFDVKGGTSTGSLIAMGVSLYPDYPIAWRSPRTTHDCKELVDLYKDRAGEIFESTRLGYAAILFNYKYIYYTEPLSKLLKQYFHDKRLLDIDPRHQEDGLAFTCLRHANRPRGSVDENIRLETFSSRRARNSACYNVRIKEACLGSAAAPVYFEPFHFSDPDIKKQVYLDGGLLANNPSEEIFRQTNGADKRPVLLASLSVGRYNPRGRPSLLERTLEALGYTAQWAMNKVLGFNFPIDSIGERQEAVHTSLQASFEENPNLGHYRRINPRLDIEEPDMDTKDSKLLRAIEDRTLDFFNQGIADEHSDLARLIRSIEGRMRQLHDQGSPIIFNMEQVLSGYPQGDTLNLSKRLIGPTRMDKIMGHVRANLGSYRELDLSDALIEDRTLEVMINRSSGNENTRALSRIETLNLSQNPIYLEDAIVRLSVIFEDLDRGSAALQHIRLEECPIKNSHKFPRTFPDRVKNLFFIEMYGDQATSLQSFRFTVDRRDYVNDSAFDNRLNVNVGNLSNDQFLVTVTRK